MIIHHSLALLEQLHELESQIKHWEQLAHQHGVQLESETLLKLALLRQKTLTETKDVS